MPYKVEKRDGQYCVVNKETGSVKGKHETKEKAERQMRALYAHEPKRK